MRVLRRGDRGHEVQHWQEFLLGQGFEPGEADGIFGRKSEAATKAFQQAHDLTPDGVVGNKTFGRAMMLGFEAVDDPIDKSDFGPNWPPPPSFPPLYGAVDRQRVFGPFDYRSAPIPSNPENIEILGDWVATHITSVTIPELGGVEGAPASHKVLFHKHGAAQLVALWESWSKAGLADRVLSWAGSFAPRYVRGSRTTLSNHAFGTAFDINARWNAFGVQPALLGERGCVRELVEIANEHGFYWGGHFTGRADGMHFELAVLREPGAPPIRPTPVPPSGGARTGSAFLDLTAGMTRAQREQAILEALLEDAVPSFGRTFVDVHLSARGPDGNEHTGTVHVAPDYAAIGTDDDFLRIPMSPLTAQRVADHLGCLLPTRKLVDVIYAAAALKLRPQPLPASPQMMSNDYFARHQRLVEEQRAGRATGQIVAGHKKDVVISNRLRAFPQRVAIYGWHQPNGQAIQPLSTIHENTYADYSHGVRWVKASMIADGAERAVADVLKDPVLSVLLSDEGVIASSRIPGV